MTQLTIIHRFVPAATYYIGGTMELKLNITDPAVIGDQQKIADLFFSLKLIPKAINVAEATIAAPSQKEN